MDWFRKHVDTVMVLGGILGAVLWMNGKFNAVEKDIAIIKAVLLMRGILPADFVCNDPNTPKMCP